MSFIHGGQLERIKQSYPDQTLPWIDLSTGISPFAYPVDISMQAHFEELPQQYTQMTQAAKAYYGSDKTIVTPGSMWAIQTIPLIRRTLMPTDARPVLLPKQGFNEHAKAWRSWGFNVEVYDALPSVEQLKNVQACVVINPNNPTGCLCDRQQLQSVHETLVRHDAWLIIDEAFLDINPEMSLANHANKKGLLVLKSFGKYFGLPGIRAGALIADDDVQDCAQRLLNQWSIHSAAQAIVTKAWVDSKWQVNANRNIKECSNRLKELLSRLGFKVKGTYFFQTFMTVQAVELYQYLLRQGIYVRLLDDEMGIRIGLPKHEYHWQRLEKALSLFFKCEVTT